MLSEVKEDPLQVLPSHLLLLKESVIKVLIALLHVILYLLLLLMMQKKICAKYYQISHLVLQKNTVSILERHQLSFNVMNGTCLAK